MSPLRVRHVAEVNPPCPAWERLPDNSEITFIPLEAVWPRRVDVSKMRKKSETSTGYARFQEGDVVVPKITPTFEADRSTWIEHIPSVVATGTTELHVVRARPGTDPRYLDYLFSSGTFLAGGTAEMIGVAGQKRVPDSWIRDFEVPVSDFAEQRAIADYLDAETARIDALIAKKQQLIHLLEERWQSIISELIWESTEARIRLKYRAGLPTSGNRDHGSFTDDDTGVACLRGLNVRAGYLNLENLRYISSRDHAQLKQTALRTDDIVIVRSGLAGSAARIPAALDPSNCVDLVVVRRSVSLDGRFLEYAINSRESQEQVSRNTAGAILNHFNAVDAGNLFIPDLPVGNQQAIANDLDGMRSSVSTLMSSLSSQLELLAERRSSLISRAVASPFT